MPAASILIKPASANCNMDCKYCFYKCLSSNREEFSKGFMSQETLETLIIEAITYADEYLTFAFQGGEPTLCGIEFFRNAVELQKKHNHKNLRIENTIQTNGFGIDEEWAKFFHDNHFLIGLSVDGPKKIHDQYRTDVREKGTFEQVMCTVELFKKYQVEFNILTVVTNDLTGKASYLYKFYKRNQFPFIQLIPCMDENIRQCGKKGEESTLTGTFAVDAEAYGKFLCQMFDLWYEDFIHGEDMEIRMFSNLAQMAAGFPAEECGMQGCCNCYFVVEGDGSVYPCDFYCMDEYRLGCVGEGFETLKRSSKVEQFESVSHILAEKCKECVYLSLCHGGCRRWREPFVDGKPRLNMLCRAYEIFFAHTKERILVLGQAIGKKMKTVP